MKTAVSLKEACELITDGTHYTPKNVGCGFPFLTVKDMTDSALDFDNCSFISEQDFIAARGGNSSPQPFDVLFSKDGTVGKVHVVKTDKPFAVLSSITILRPRLNLVDSEYLGHVLKSPSILDQALRRKTGSAIRRIILSDLSKVRIPLPPIAEQKQIAAILDKADELRGLRRKALGELDAIAQSIFLEMFGDPVTNPKGNKVAKLSEVATRITDGVHQKPNYTESGVPFISVKDITTGILRFDNCKFISQEDHAKYTKRCRPEFQDILYTKVGATYGRPALINTDKEFSIYVSVCLIKPNRELIDPSFLCTALGTSAVKSQADRRIKGIGVPDLHLDQIQKFLIPLPSMDEQREFTKRIQAIEQLKATHRESLTQLDALFASLQHRAFRGDL